jgi:hypothetical protein
VTARARPWLAAILCAVSLGLSSGARAGDGVIEISHSNPGPDVVLSPAPGPHPTSGFMNLCSGIPGPAPSCP